MPTDSLVFIEHTTAPKVLRSIQKHFLTKALIQVLHLHSMIAQIQQELSMTGKVPILYNQIVQPIKLTKYSKKIVGGGILR